MPEGSELSLFLREGGHRGTHPLPHPPPLAIDPHGRQVEEEDAAEDKDGAWHRGHQPLFHVRQHSSSSSTCTRKEGWRALFKIQFFISFHKEQYSFILFDELSMSLMNCTKDKSCFHFNIQDSVFGNMHVLWK